MLLLQPGEEIIFFTRRHWIVLLFSIIPIILAGFILFSSVAIVPTLELFSEFSQYEGLLDLGLALILQALWVALFVAVIDYYLDVWIITNERLIRVELVGLFSRSVSSIEWDRIEDVTTKVIGVIPTFLNYGDVIVFTAGNEDGYRFKQVPNPYEFKERIIKARDARMTVVNPFLGR